MHMKMASEEAERGVVIVGGGICGLATALALHRYMGTAPLSTTQAWTSLICNPITIAVADKLGVANLQCSLARRWDAIYYLRSQKKMGPCAMAEYLMFYPSTILHRIHISICKRRRRMNCWHGIGRNGIASVVLEKCKNLRSTGAAIILQPNGWRALDHLGLGIASLLRRTSLPIHS